MPIETMSDNNNNDHDVEDILSDALELIDDDAAKDLRSANEERVQYGDLILRVAPKVCSSLIHVAVLITSYAHMYRKERSVIVLHAPASARCEHPTAKSD
jgi:hypothetical protein